MKRPLSCVLTLVVATLTLASAAWGFPKPATLPSSWELTFQHATPHRLVVNLPGEANPKAFWYMTFTVTNTTDEEQMFLPVCELQTQDGRVVRSDDNISPVVFDAIKTREKKKLMEPLAKVTGRLLVGDDQARESVAIWPETRPDMGPFSIYVGGLSGEAVMFKKVDNNLVPIVNAEDGRDLKNVVVLRKTLKIDYQVLGDALYPGNDPIKEVGTDWIMR